MQKTRAISPFFTHDLTHVSPLHSGETVLSGQNQMSSDVRQPDVTQWNFLRCSTDLNGCFRSGLGEQTFERASSQSWFSPSSSSEQVGRSIAGFRTVQCFMEMLGLSQRTQVGYGICWIACMHFREVFYLYV